MAKEHAIQTYEFEVIASFVTNVLYDIAIDHPFRDHREPPILEGVGNPDEIEDVWMAQVLPQGNFFTKVLCDA